MLPRSASAGLLATLTTLLTLPAARAVPSFFDWMPPPTACDSTHSPSPAPNAGPPPPLPPLPQQYSMKVEANIHQKGWTSEVEEHYDGINQRASVSRTFNGTTVLTIYNFKDGERYDIYPNSTCRTSPASVDFFRFVRVDKNGRPAMSSINEVFGFGSRYNQTYIGKENVRGIMVNHWTSCQEWPRWGAKFQLDYYFSHPDYTMAAGPAQLPVRAVLNGSASNVDMLSHRVKGDHQFSHVYDFVSMRPGPPADKVFEIPMGVACQGRAQQEPMPEMPDKFQMTIEMMVDNVITAPFQQQLRYDYEHQLVETWHQATLPQKFLRAGTTSTDTDELQRLSVSKLEDFDNGIVYHMDKTTMNCTASKMSNSRGHVTMDHGKNILNLPDAAATKGFQYQGKRTVRQMLVDVWATEVDGLHQELYFLLPARDMRENWQHPSRGDQQPTDGKTTFRPPPPGSRHSPGSHSAPSENDTPPPQSRPSPPEGYTPSPPPGRRPTPPGRRPPPPGSRPGPPGSPSSSSSPATFPGPGMRAKSKITPYPVLVGMYLRNRTALAYGSMATLFREVFTPEAMQWAGMAGRDSLADTQGNSFQQEGRESWQSWRDSHRSMEHADRLMWMLKREEYMFQRVPHKLVQIFGYSPTLVDTSSFQVSACYPPEEISHILVMVHTNFALNVMPKFADFSNNMRSAIARSMGVSVLQISNLLPMPVKNEARNVDTTSVTFTLLGDVGVQGKKKPIPIAEAKGKLIKAIEHGIGFNVAYSNHSKTFIVDKHMYTVDYDTYKSSTGSGTVRAGQPGAVTSSKDNGSTTYSSAEVGGIALATLLLGAVVTLVVLFALYRRRHPGEAIMSYRLTT